MERRSQHEPGEQIEGRREVIIDRPDARVRMRRERTAPHVDPRAHGIRHEAMEPACACDQGVGDMIEERLELELLGEHRILRGDPIDEVGHRAQEPAWNVSFLEPNLPHIPTFGESAATD